jgi:hypothetical protein
VGDGVILPWLVAALVADCVLIFGVVIGGASTAAIVISICAWSAILGVLSRLLARRMNRPWIDADAAPRAGSWSGGIVLGLWVILVVGLPGNSWMPGVSLVVALVGLTFVVAVTEGVRWVTGRIARNRQ